VIFSDITEWLPLIERLGVPLFMLLLLIVTGARGVWVWGYQYRANEKLWRERLESSERREADWKQMAVSGTLIAERATGREKWTITQRLEFLEDQAARRRSSE
jgi:hypothetical protein